MDQKTFGLVEAQKIAGRNRVSVPTVKAMLEILGIPNVVGQQAQAAVAACRGAIQAAAAKIADARRHKADEEKRVAEAIDALNRELAVVVKATGTMETEGNKAIELTEQQITALTRLAKKFGG